MGDPVCAWGGQGMALKVGRGRLETSLGSLGGSWGCLWGHWGLWDVPGVIGGVGMS